MPTQKLMIAAIAGHAGEAVGELFRGWRAARLGDGWHDNVRQAVDVFCEGLRAHGSELPVVYFSEWVDRWLMGDDVPGPEAVSGCRCEAACTPSADLANWARRLGNQHQEHRWLVRRLREATQAWQPLSGATVVVVAREVLGGSATDEEVTASFQVVPAWLARLTGIS